MGSGAMISLRGRKAMVAKNRMGRKQMSAPDRKNQLAKPDAFFRFRSHHSTPDLKKRRTSVCARMTVAISSSTEAAEA